MNIRGRRYVTKITKKEIMDKIKEICRNSAPGLGKMWPRTTALVTGKIGIGIGSHIQEVTGVRKHAG
jgi:hypothetical protein